MASFSKLNSQNIVIKVESVVNEVLQDSNGIEQESIGIQFLKNLYSEPNSIWKQTSYSTFGGVHKLGGTPFRKNYAGVGYIYDPVRDAFYSEQPYASWILNEDTCYWQPPTPRPEGMDWYWSESVLAWTEHPDKPY